MKQNTCPERFFSTLEYVFCDTAFKLSDICIPAYKTDALFYQSAEKMKFNKAMCPPRICTEHTIGLWKWKCRLPWLRWIRMCSTNDPKSLETILHYTDY